MNDLEKFFSQNDGRLIHKWKHYFEIYDRHFSRFRGRPVNIVEFGVSQGGSIQMWRHYFGAHAKIFGVDINPSCKQFEEPGVKIFIGDQEDRQFLQSVANPVPAIDILIDDGGHTMRQQIATFEELFPYVTANGVYLVEDLHTSYWDRWGGGYKRHGSFIEYSKNFIDQINACHSKQPRKFKVSDFTKTAKSLHFYDSVLVVEKHPMVPPSHARTGHAQFPDYDKPYIGLLQKLKRKLRRN